MIINNQYAPQFNQHQHQHQHQHQNRGGDYAINPKAHDAFYYNQYPQPTPDDYAYRKMRLSSTNIKSKIVEETTLSSLKRIMTRFTVDS